MIDLIEKLREEHYRKKGLPKYQDAGEVSIGSKEMPTNFLNGIYKKPFDTGSEQVNAMNSDGLEDEKPEDKKPPEDPTSLLQKALKFWTPNDLETNLFSIGRMAKYKPKDTSGKVAKGVAMSAYGLASGLNIFGQIAKGVGFQNQNNLAEKYNNDVLAQRDYKNAQGTANKNNSGGMSFQDGGEQVSEEPMQEEQGMEQQEEGQQQEQEEGQGQIPQKVLDIANQLVESFDTIEEIDMYLKQNKVDENTYNMIMEAASDIIDANSEEEDQTEEEEVEEEEDIKEGDYVEFEHGGKMHKGRVSKIVNGKIYL
jgi:hypothetical protein